MHVKGKGRTGKEGEEGREEIRGGGGKEGEWKGGV